MLLLIAAALLAVVGRTAHLQTAGGDRARSLAQSQQHARAELPARRGGIFDANGLLLAGTVPSRDVFIDPAFYREQVGDPADADAGLDALAEILRLDPLELAQTLGRRREGRYVVLAKDVSDADAEAIARLGLRGVGTTPGQRRFYPAGTTAGHVLGGVGAGGRGLEGLELALDADLTGHAGDQRWLRDGRSNPLMLAATDLRRPEHGRHAVLTLDANLQRIAEQELAAACNEFNAPSAECVVLDPWTGDVLALAVWPGYDPSAPGEATPERRRNRAITDPYEPGSVVKPFVVAAALDAGVTTLGEIWPTRGPTWRTAYGRRITDVHAYDELATWDVLVKSSNIGMSMIADRAGPAALRDGLARFGFGSPTGVDLPGEGGGLLNPLGRWTTYTPESVAQGYELLATPMQLARAMAALANGGRLIVPRLEQGTLDDAGRLTPAERPLGEQVISPESAAAIRRVLADAAVRGTARHARLGRYNLFGKTGTAHQAVNGKYNDTDYAASFVGGAPYEAPRLVVALVIHNPDKSISHFGGIVAAPAAARILERGLDYLGAPDSPALPPYPAGLTLWGEAVTDDE